MFGNAPSALTIHVYCVPASFLAFASMNGDDNVPAKKVEELSVRVNDLEATLREALCTIQNNQKSLQTIIEQYVTCIAFCRKV